MSYLSPKLNALMQAWRQDMATYGSAALDPCELEDAITIEVAMRQGWAKAGGLWEQPDKSKQWAWTDQQLIEHLKGK